MTVWLRFVGMVSGEASQLLHGTIEILELSVKSLGSHGRVSSFLLFNMVCGHYNKIV